jgi:hypothetical protein
MPARFMSVAQHRACASANLLMWAVRSHSGSSAYIKHFHPRSGLRVAGRRSRPCTYSGMEAWRGSRRGRFVDFARLGLGGL